MKEREALKLALVAMNECLFDEQWYVAKEAIKEALANHIPDAENMVAQPEQERTGEVRLPTSVEEAELMEKLGYAYLQQHAPERLAQPEKEPVAWMRKDETCTDCFVWERTDEHTIPLYTTPPQRTWVGLTDEEIQTMWQNTSPYYDHQDFALAIEAKLKEKNT